MRYSFKIYGEKGTKYFDILWPQREDKCHIPFVYILCIVPAPSIYDRNGQLYRLEHVVADIFCKNFPQYTEKKV
jgi:hypothetical protein